MPSLAMCKIAPPTDFAEFEKICMDYLSHKYNADATLYGRKGQSQQGIDIVITTDEHAFVLAQCKDMKEISDTQFDKWIEFVESKCSIPMKELVIVVAVDRDAKLQEHACKVLHQRKQEGRVPVRLYFWDDVLHYVKQNPTMLRMYYPDLYRGEIIKLQEAVKSPEEKFPEMINKEYELRKAFFAEAVHYSIEEFLEYDPRQGIPHELACYADAFIYSIRKLLQRSPMLKEYSNRYSEIEDFMRSFDEYTEFLTSVTEGRAGKLYATNKYHTKEEEADLRHNEELRIKALQDYNYIKE